MRLGRFTRAAVVAVASLLSVVAAAQSGAGGGRIDIPQDVRIVGKQDDGVRKATAIVNGEVITETDIDHRLALLLDTNNITLPPEELQRARAQVLRALIDESLQIQAAAQEDIRIEDREVDQFLNNVARENNQTREQLAAYLRSIGSSERSLRRQIRGGMAWQRLQSRRIAPFVSVGEDEVETILAQLNAARGTTEYRVFEIFVTATPETAAETHANAARLVQQIRGGANFSAIARQFSEASTAAVGGDLGWVRPAQIPAELTELVTQMPVGAISDPIQLTGGYSIVMLADKRQILTNDPRNALLSLMQLSIELPPGISEAQAQARAGQLELATQSMGGCGRADEVARSLGAELISNDQMRVRELPPQLQPILLDMNIGQATPPFGSIERVSVLVLCGRDDPPDAGMPTFDAVYTQINEDRVNRRAQRFLRDLRRDAVIDYR